MNGIAEGMRQMTGVFSNIRIAAFTWAIVGPLVVKYFADQGATVIRLETASRPCAMRTAPPFKDGQRGIDRSGYFAHTNSNQYSMSVNLSHPLAKRVVDRLVSNVDIVVDNFAPGVMENWGLTYDELVKVKPDLIMLRTSNLGQTGPHAKKAGFGMLLDALAGFPNLIGWPSQDPQPVGIPYSDVITPPFAASVLIAALLYKRRTGKGQFIDVSQFEVSIRFLASYILDYTVNGKFGTRRGNSSPSAVPHGIFRCSGEDRWCAVAVLNDDQWRSFCRVVEKEEWTDDPRFKTFLARKRNEETLNSLINNWTQSLSAEEVMNKLQRAGIPSGVVANAADLYNDPQLRHREHLRFIQHKELGDFPVVGQPSVLSETPYRITRPSPCLGEHTESVCTELLGMSDQEFVELLNHGVFE